MIYKFIPNLLVTTGFEIKEEFVTFYCQTGFFCVNSSGAFVGFTVDFDTIEGGILSCGADLAGGICISIQVMVTVLGDTLGSLWGILVIGWHTLSSSREIGLAGGAGVVKGIEASRSDTKIHELVADGGSNRR